MCILHIVRAMNPIETIAVVATLYVTFFVAHRASR